MNSPEPARRPRVHEFRRLSGAIEDLDHESICVAPNKSDGLGISRESFDCFDRHGSSRHISAEHDQIDVRALDILKHRAQCVKIPMKIAQHRDSLDQTFLTTEPVLRIMQCPLWISATCESLYDLHGSDLRGWT